MNPLIKLSRNRSCLIFLNSRGVWSPLRQGGVWPQSPRNFATEPVVGGWRDLLRKTQEAGTPNNITFTITFENTVNNDATRILYGSAPSDPFGIRQESNGNITAFTAYAAPVSHSTEYYPVIVYAASAHGGAFLTGRHTVKVELIGTTLRVYLDDVGIHYASLVDRITPKYTTGTDSAAGYLYDVEISSDDEIWWNYPSWLEEKRIVTYTNVLNAGTHWEAANTALGWLIKTAVPVNSAGTVLAKINGTVVANSSKWSRSTSTFAGLAADKLEWITVFDEELSAELIASCT